MSDGDRYFLRASFGAWTEVTRERWLATERAAGFYPKGGGTGPATAGFGTGLVEGRILPASNVRAQWAWDPDFVAVAFPL